MDVLLLLDLNQALWFDGSEWFVPRRIAERQAFPIRKQAESRWRRALRLRLRLGLRLRPRQLINTIALSLHAHLPRTGWIILLNLGSPARMKIISQRRRVDLFSWGDRSSWGTQPVSRCFNRETLDKDSRTPIRVWWKQIDYLVFAMRVRYCLPESHCFHRLTD